VFLGKGERELVIVGEKLLIVVAALGDGERKEKEEVE
jgi:hypothetical protein